MEVSSSSPATDDKNKNKNEINDMSVSIDFDFDPSSNEKELDSFLQKIFNLNGVYEFDKKFYLNCTTKQHSFLKCDFFKKSKSIGLNNFKQVLTLYYSAPASNSGSSGATQPSTPLKSPFNSTNATSSSTPSPGFFTPTKINVPSSSSHFSLSPDSSSSSSADMNLSPINFSVNSNPSSPKKNTIMSREGRLGPDFVSLYRNSGSGHYNLSQNNLRFEGLSNIASIRTNVCVISGSWQFEVTLHTSHPNLLRIGWHDVKSPLLPDSLLGDSANSFAIDGLKKKKISKKVSQNFGQFWTEGDVIGCCLKLSRESSEISYYRNGTLLGIPFSSKKTGKNPAGKSEKNNNDILSVKFGEGYGYFAGISVGLGQKISCNFGAKPFEWPVPGFEPLQGKPVLKNFEKFQTLISGLNFLLEFQIFYSSFHNKSENLEIEILIGNTLEILVGFLSCLNNGPGEYLITDQFVPFLIQIFKTDSKNFHGEVQPNEKLKLLVKYLTSYWEEWEKETIFGSIFTFLISKCGRGFSLAEGRPDYQNRLNPKNNEKFVDSLDCLHLLTELISNQELMFLFVHLNGGTSFNFISTSTKNDDGSSSKNDGNSNRSSNKSNSNNKSGGGGGNNNNSGDVVNFYEVLESLMCTKGLTQGDLIYILPRVYIEGIEAEKTTQGTKNEEQVKGKEKEEEDLEDNLIKQHTGLMDNEEEYNFEIKKLQKRVSRHEKLILRLLILIFDFKIDSQFYSFYFSNHHTNNSSSNKSTSHNKSKNKNVNHSNKKNKNSNFNHNSLFNEEINYIEGKELLKAAIEYLVEKNELIDVDTNQIKIGLSDPSVIFNYYFAILSLLKIKFNYLFFNLNSLKNNSNSNSNSNHNLNSVNIFPGKKYFVSDYFGRNFEEQTRLGGTVSHLRKHFPVQNIQKDEIIEISNYNHHKSNNVFETPEKKSLGKTLVNLNRIKWEDEMVQHLITLFNYIVWKRYRLASLYRSSQTEAIDRLKESSKKTAAFQSALSILRKSEKNSNTKDSLTEVPNTDLENKIKVLEIELEDLKVGRLVFVDDAIDAIRRSLWHEMMLFTSRKQQDEFAFVSFLIFLIEKYSISCKSDNIYHYIPQIYLETALNGLQGIVGGFDLFKKKTKTNSESHSTTVEAPPSTSDLEKQQISLHSNPSPTSDSNLENLSVFEIFKNLIGEFLLEHLTDTRIVNPEMRDLFLQTIALILTNFSILEIFQENTFVNENLMLMIINAFNYDKNNSANWVIVSAILPRFWLGTNFNSKNSSNEVSPHTKTNIFRKRFVEISETPVFQVFLNNLLNHLNWTFTELNVIMRELTKIPALSAQHWVVGSDGYRLLQRCGSFFELVVKLLKIVELISLEVPKKAFVEDEMNRRRIMELLLYVLTRTTSGNEANVFESVLSLGASQFGLDSITRSTILSPIVGSILNLIVSENKHQEETQAGDNNNNNNTNNNTNNNNNNNNNNIVNEIVGLELYKEEMFEYLEQFEWKEETLPKLQQWTIIVQNLKEAKREKQEKQEEKKERASRASDRNEDDASSGNKGTSQNEKDEDEDDELCSICYSEKLNTTFIPCKHRSCKRCIQRHMLESDSCFFCKAKIQTLLFDQF